jgi:hypothetical protein
MPEYAALHQVHAERARLEIEKIFECELHHIRFRRNGLHLSSARTDDIFVTSE